MLGAYFSIGVKIADALWIISVLVMLVLMARVVGRLKREHREVHVTLGNPGVFSGRRDPNKLNLWNYIQSKQYFNLNDEELNSRIRWFKLSYTAFVVLCVPVLILNF